MCERLHVKRSKRTTSQQEDGMKAEKHSSLYYKRKWINLKSRPGGMMVHISNRIPLAWREIRMKHNRQPTTRNYINIYLMTYSTHLEMSIGVVTKWNYHCEIAANCMSVLFVITNLYYFYTCVRLHFKYLIRKSVSNDWWNCIVDTFYTKIFNIVGIGECIIRNRLRTKAQEIMNSCEKG